MAYKVKPADIPKWEALNRALQSLAHCGLDLDARNAGEQAIVTAMDQLKTGSGNNPRKPYTLDTRQFGVAYEYVTMQIEYGEAVALLCEISSFEEGTAKKHLKEMGPRAMSLAKLLNKPTR